VTARVSVWSEPGANARAFARELPLRAGRMLRFLRLERAELSLGFVSAGRMAELNREHLGKRGPTDVLSFPQLDPEEASALGYGLDAELAGAPFPRRTTARAGLLGDVVLAPPVVRAQAREAGRTALAEGTMLLAHGLLHLLGFDHRDAWEEALMRARTVWLERVGEGKPPRLRSRRPL